MPEKKEKSGKQIPKKQTCINWHALNMNDEEKASLPHTDPKTIIAANSKFAKGEVYPEEKYRQKITFRARAFP